MEIMLENPRQCWRTPPELFHSLHGIFGFSIDACASPANALLPRYWTREQDCRDQDWTGERVFCNPPFGEGRTILPKGATAELAVFLLRADSLVTGYFVATEPRYVAIPPRRIRFLPAPGVRAGTPNHGIVLLLYGAVTSAHVASLRRLGLSVFSQVGEALVV